MVEGINFSRPDNRLKILCTAFRIEQKYHISANIAPSKGLQKLPPSNLFYHTLPDSVHRSVNFIPRGLSRSTIQNSLWIAYMSQESPLPLCIVLSPRNESVRGGPGHSTVTNLYDDVAWRCKRSKGCIFVDRQGSRETMQPHTRVEIVGMSVSPQDPPIPGRCTKASNVLKRVTDKAVHRRGELQVDSGTVLAKL